VAALWGLANGVLVLVLRAYGGSAVDLGLYAGAVGLVECYAVAVALSSRRRPGPRRVVWMARSALPAAVVAFALAVAAFSFAYWPWPAPVALFLLLAGVTLAVRDSRRIPG
jgi:hypothetical protein